MHSIENPPPPPGQWYHPSWTRAPTRMAPAPRLRATSSRESQGRVKQGEAKVTKEVRGRTVRERMIRGFLGPGLPPQAVLTRRGRRTHRRDHLADGLPKGRFHSTP